MSVRWLIPVRGFRVVCPRWVGDPSADIAIRTQVVASSMTTPGRRIGETQVGEIVELEQRPQDRDAPPSVGVCYSAGRGGPVRMSPRRWLRTAQSAAPLYLVGLCFPGFRFGLG